MRFLRKIWQKIRSNVKVKITYNDQYINEEMNPNALEKKAMDKMNKNRLRK